jgi:predicted ATP-grasp superfamily ATP-dependent carboligase
VLGRVLITDGEDRSSLAACRTLHAAGYRVTCVHVLRTAPAAWSRRVAAARRLPDPRIDADAFVDGLVEIVSAHRHHAVIPGGDAALLAISRQRERLEPHVGLGLPPHEAVERSLDKLATGEAAERAGIPAPASLACSTAAEAAAAAEQTGYPVLVKPRRTVFRDGSWLRHQSSLWVSEPAELEDALRLAGNEWLIQPAVEGAVHSFSGVRTPDGLIAQALSRYVRTWPAQAGNASFAHTIPVLPALAARVEAMLADLGWVGIFEVELIGRPDGGFATLDLNPRVFGTLALVSAAGAPLAEVWCRWLGGQATAPAIARPGVRYRWEDAELRNAVRHMRRGQLRGALAVAHPRRRVAHAFFAAGDPVPALARAAWLAAPGRRRLWAAPDAMVAPAPRRVPVQAP